MEVFYRGSNYLPVVQSQLIHFSMCSGTDAEGQVGEPGGEASLSYCSKWNGGKGLEPGMVTLFICQRPEEAAAVIYSRAVFMSSHHSHQPLAAASAPSLALEGSRRHSCAMRPFIANDCKPLGDPSLAEKWDINTINKHVSGHNGCICIINLIHLETAVNPGS